jgi:DNA mismatch repair protein MSH5
MESKNAFPRKINNESESSSPKSCNLQSSTFRSPAPQPSLSTPTIKYSQARLQVQTPLPITHSKPVADFITESLHNNDILTESNLNDIDALNEVIMAVDLRERGTVGCCYYVARDEKLCFMEDVKFGGVDVVDSCM